MTVAALIAFAIFLIVIGIVVGALVYIIRASPMAEPFKGWAAWAVLAIGILIVLYRLLLIAGIAA